MDKKNSGKKNEKEKELDEKSLNSVSGGTKRKGPPPKHLS